MQKIKIEMELEVIDQTPEEAHEAIQDHVSAWHNLLSSNMTVLEEVEE